MSNHVAFRRQPVPQQVAQSLQAVTLPAPTRGLIESENYTYMAPGGAIVMDNWIPTMRGAKLRGGCIKWCTLPERSPVISAFDYVSGSVGHMFAATATALYNVTSDTAVLVKDAQSDGNYTACQLANLSGDYLIALNDGGDYPLRYDGSVWTILDADQINGLRAPQSSMAATSSTSGSIATDGCSSRAARSMLGISTTTPSRARCN